MKTSLLCASKSEELRPRFGIILFLLFALAAAGVLQCAARSDYVGWDAGRASFTCLPSSFSVTTEHRTTITLRIYDLEGRIIRTMTWPDVAAGTRTIEWDGLNEDGGAVPSGTYFYRINVGDVEQIGRCDSDPFTPSTTIYWAVDQPTPVTLSIYDIEGDPVRTLRWTKQETGIHTFQWDGSDEEGQPVESGVYIYRLEIGDEVITRKLFLLR